MDPELDNTNHCIPSEICILILSYLPVKSLLRFRSVSKEWKSIIDSHDFASYHLSRYPNNSLESHLLVFERDGKNNKLRAQLLTTCYTDNQYHQQILEFDSPGSAAEPPFSLRSLYGVTRIVGDCQGLLLMQSSNLGRWWFKGNVMIWNPSIRKSLDIPHPPSLSGPSLPQQCYRSLPYSEIPLDLCLSLDPSTNDYKVVNILHYYKKAITCEIFSLNSSSWRSGRTTPPDEIHCGLSGSNSKKVFFGGYVYWVARGEGIGDKTFVSFSVISETLASFAQLPNPSKLYDDALDVPVETPVVVAGSMVGLLRTSMQVNDIWVL